MTAQRIPRWLILTVAGLRGGLAAAAGLAVLLVVPWQIRAFQANGLTPPAPTRALQPVADALGVQPAVGLALLLVAGVLCSLVVLTYRRRWLRLTCFWLATVTTPIVWFALACGQVMLLAGRGG